MRSLSFAVLSLLLLVSACGKSDAPAEKKDTTEEAGLSLKADEMRGLGIATRPAVAADWRGQVGGYGAVIALDAVAQADSDYMTAQATAAQSAAAARRAQSLATGEEAAISREALEVAQSKAAADAAVLTLARNKTDAAFGLNSPWRNRATRRVVMQRLAAGRSVLVRVTFPISAVPGQVPASLIITRLGANAASWTSGSVWEAPADATTPGRSFYALVDGSNLAQNERVTAAVPVGAAQSGAVVPADALVYGENEAWVYVQSGSDHFQRVRVDTGKPVEMGYFVGGAVKPGDKVVVSGAGLLLARELNPSTEVED
jgi:hypothetical protein